ncbi:putative flippase [Halanaeroarchaeum sp. HSR-CO]|uniref:lysylphosphatidylglycerol synthase transmembrane domain-containing protein n=1 Tax=Halanaeroarchaeum sp. HSR-CO TaxID=2866382 RepID=UPI00217E97D9|nr:lysylphosphatidylglycerol synthase transmembrane domain-containing protein [Halanaeroarchaeum sp. HSR-CO]UWG47741.1 putative flippase [Halanaeroarchaeum sp. HSR-CO]
MSRVDRRALVLGFAGAGALIVGLLWLVDVGQVRSSLSRADPLFLGVMFVVALLWLGAWAVTLRTVLASMDVPMPVGTSFFVYNAAVFANNVTPFGQAGGEPVTALLVSKVTGTRYETGLVSIASVDVLNAVSSIALVFFGVGIYASRFTLGTNLFAAVSSVVILVLVIVVSFTLTWRYRETLVDRLSGPIATTADAFRWGPLKSRTVTKAGVAARLRRFFGNVEVVAGDQRRLVYALSLSMLGWLLQTAALVMAFLAVGADIPVVVALFVIPLANLAGMAPLPGGLGGIEAAFVALLVPTTGVPAAVVTAAVLLFRLAIYWMPVIVGGTSATVFGVKVLS